MMGKDFPRPRRRVGRRMAIATAMAAICSGLAIGTLVAIGVAWLLEGIVAHGVPSAGTGPRPCHISVSARMRQGPDTDAAPQLRTPERFACPSSAPTTPSAHRALDRPGHSISVGERLKYDLLAAGIKVGEAEFAVEDEEVRSEGRGEFTVSFKARTNRFASLFYKVETDATSTIERSLLRSLGYRLAKVEDAHRTEVRITLDYPSGLVSTMRVDGSGSPVRRSLEISGSVHDPVSWFYGVRGMRLDEGPPGEMTIVISNRVSLVPLIVDGAAEFELRDRTRLQGVRINIPGGGSALMGREGDVALLLEERTMISLQVLVSDGSRTAGLRLVSAKNSPLNIDSTETSVALKGQL